MSRFYEFRPIGKPGKERFLKSNKKCKNCEKRFSSFNLAKVLCKECSYDGTYTSKIIKKCAKCENILNDARSIFCDECKKKR